MIEREINEDSHTGRIIIRPHRSATWHQNLILLGAIAIVALPVALYWSLLGFWLIFPLAMIQILLVGWAFWISSYKLLAREVVTIEAERVVIEAGHRRPERRFELPRGWAEVLLWPAGRHNHPSRLIVRAGDRAVECGRFLTEEERKALWRDLCSMIPR